LTARDVDETRRIVESLRSRNKDSLGNHLAMAALLLAGHDKSGADGEFRKALAMKPDSPAAYEGLGNLALQRNDAKTAEEYLKKAADLSLIRAPVRIRYADFLIEKGSLDEARHGLDEITSKAPDFIPGWTESMRVAVAQKRYDDCVAYAEKVLARDPTNYDAMVRRATVKLTKEDADGAIADLKVAQGYYPQTPIIKYELALAYLKKSDDTAAEESLHGAIQLAPKYDDALILLAGIRIRKGDPDSAIGLLTPVLKRQPRDSRALLLLAQAYRLQGGFGQALTIYTAMAAASSSTPSFPYLAGMALFEGGRRDEARSWFEKSVKISADYWPAVEMLVNLDLMDKRYTQAADRVAALVEKDPGSSDALILRSRVRLAQDDTDAAEADLEKAVDLSPGSTYAYLHLSELYLKGRQTDKALERLHSLADKTNSKTAWMLIGIINEQLKKFDAAQNAYETLLKIDPKFEPALNNLAYMYSEALGQPEKGYDLAKRARELAPDDPNAADTLGWIQFRKGDYLGALPLIQESAEKEPSEPGIQYHLGMAHYYLGQEEPARQAFQKAISTVGESPVKADAAQRLAVLAIDPQKADEAVRADLEKRVHERADDPLILYRLGRIQERDGDAAGAAASYESALRIEPKSAHIMLSLGQIYAGTLKKPDRARELARAIHQLLPNDAQTSWAVARIGIQTGDYAWSATLLEEASADASDADLIDDSAYASYCAGRQHDAEMELQKIGADAPPAVRERAERLSTMIAASTSLPNAQAALPDARKILADDPGYIPALMVSALAREQAGDVQGAQQAYEDLLARDPDFSPAMRQLSVLYGERIGDDKKAEELATKARKSLPDDAAVNFELGAVNFRRGDFQAAVSYLQQSFGRDADQAEVQFYLGMSYYQLKNTALAREDLQKAIELHLSDREADEARRLLKEIQDSEGAN
jgi:tetratricopeptide (TPR) repeat protein